MNKEQVIGKLGLFKHRLSKDVLEAYSTRGCDFGRERFSSWRRQITKFLDENLSGTSSILASKLKLSVHYRGSHESDADVFIREYGEPSNAFIDSLILDINNDEYDFSSSTPKDTPINKTKNATDNKRVFIVHGHDELIKTKVARFIEKIGLEAVILHEQANKGMTIIEKIESHTEVGFAIVLYTPDDQGAKNEDASNGKFSARARQNVVFEHGFLIAKLSRERVVPLVTSIVELPGDISGMVYTDDSNWEIDIAKEMKAVGYNIDFNRLISD